MKRWAVVLSALLVLGLFLYAERDRLPPSIAEWMPGGGTGATQSAAPDTGKDKANAAGKPIAVKAEIAKTGSLPILRQTIGTIVPIQTTELSSPVSGIVASVAIKDGATVKSGDLIVQLDDRAITSQIEKDKALMAKDQATLDNANSSLKRIENLVGTGVDTKQAGDDARAAVRQAEAAVTADQAQIAADQVSLAYTRILAPFDGQLGAVGVSPGAYLAAGSPVVTLTQMKPVYGEFALSESDLGLARGALSAGKLRVDVKGQGASAQSGSGPIVFIDNNVDGPSGTFKLRAELSNEDGRLWPGQSLDVTVNAGDVPNLIVVPNAAVEPRDGGFVSFVVKPDQTIEPRPVTVALRVDGKAGIASGLQPGELVVTEGQALLRNGSKVVVTTASDPSPATAAPKEAATQ